MFELVPDAPAGWALPTILFGDAGQVAEVVDMPSRACSVEQEVLVKQVLRDTCAKKRWSMNTCSR